MAKETRPLVEGKFLQYLDKPLVREENTICYGDMNEKCILILEIISYKEVEGKKLPDKIMIQVIDSKDPNKIIKQGDKGVALTYDMLGNAMVSFRSGGKYTYGILGVGCNAQIEERLAVEAGYGLQVPVCRWLDVNNEFKATTMGYNSGYTRSNFSYLLAPSLTLWHHCNLFAGASINYFMSDRASAATLLPNAGLWRKEGDRGIGQLYLGYQVGVQYVF